MKVTSSALFCLALLGSFASPAMGQSPPNVILIMTDDQGYGDFGCLGNPVIQTPNIDALAAAGVSISDFYVSPVCSPTRASLMTGRNNIRTQCIDTYLGRSMMSTEEITLAEALGSAGYATGIFGKWHLGDCYPMRPSDQGFEESFIHRGGGIAQPSEPRDNARRYTNPILIHNDHEVEAEGYCADLYFEAAQAFISEAAADERPFFAYIASNTPHGPFHDVPESWLEYYQEHDVRPVMSESDAESRGQINNVERIFAMISNVDDNVGKLVESLEEAELLNNTIIIFLVDNGPNTSRYVGPFRGKKSHIFEGGIRSPCWIRWDAKLPAGEEVDLLGAHIDIFPTVLEACQVELPEGIEYDGRSMLGPLTGTAEADADRAVVIQGHRGDRPIQYNHCMIRRGPWKLLNSTTYGRESSPGEPRWQLYHIGEDPGERNNQAEDQPDLVAELVQEYDAWFASANSEFEARQFPPPIIIDANHETTCVLTWQDWFGGTWSSTHPGEWSLQFAEGGRYDVQLLMPFGGPIDEEGWTLRLKINDEEWLRPLPLTEEIITIEALSLPAGPATLSAVYEKEGETTKAFYQVRLIRR